MKRNLAIALLTIALGCQPKDEVLDRWQGDWSAKWTTDPASYGELANGMHFEMDGIFSFDNEQVTVHVYGYKNCIFGVDTLSHSQSWSLSGDTLKLWTNPEDPGIQYTVLSQSDEQIELKLLDDIFIKLSKRPEEKPL